MKKIFILILLLNSIIAIAQKREDNKIFEIVEESPKLTIAKGWMKNNTSGKWVENKNVLATKKIYSFSDLSHYDQNFEWIQIVKITKDSEKYYVIVYRQVYGYYEDEGYTYVSGWTPSRRTRYAILTTADYQLLKENIERKEGKDFSIKVANDGEVYKSLMESLNSLLNIIKEGGSTVKTINISPSFLFNAQTLNDEEIVRFRLMYGYFGKRRKQGYNDYDTNENLDNSYFEISKEEFSKLLID